MRSQIYSEVIPEENTVSMQDTMDGLKSESEEGPTTFGQNLGSGDSENQFLFKEKKPRK